MEIEREERRGERIISLKRRVLSLVGVFPFRDFIISRDYDGNLTEFQTILGKTVNELKTAGRQLQNQLFLWYDMGKPGPAALGVGP